MADTTTSAPAAADAANSTAAAGAPAPSAASDAAGTHTHTHTGADAGSAPAPAAPAKHATSGVLLIAGSASYSLTGRSDAPKSMYDGVPEINLYNFHTLSLTHTGTGTPPEGRLGPNVRSVISGPTSVHFVAITDAGEAFVWGRNERGQLGLGHTRNVYVPERVPGLERLAGAATGRAHTLFVTEAGEVYACGENKSAQCGIGRATDAPLLKPTKVAGVANAVAAGAGTDFSVVLTREGRVLTCGSQQYGQCGTGTTGEYIVSAGKTAFAEIPAFRELSMLNKIKAIAVGANHSAALDEDGLVYTWGAGTYGRCGHGDVADALVPKSVKQLENPRMRCKSIAAGNSITYVVTQLGEMMFYFGVTKKSSEAALYPKPVSDLAGWHPRSIASGNTSTMVAADASVVAWGPSPTCGELGFGETTKSSTKCKLIDDLEGCHVIQVAMGYAASLAILDVSSETPEGRKGKELLASGKLKAYEAPAIAPASVSAGAATSAAPAAKAGTKRGAIAAGAAATKKKK